MGPGVKHLGVDHSVWSDHTDVRPTMLELLGLRDDYQHEGRVLFEILNPAVLPAAVRERLGELIGLAQFFKQINAPVGELGLETLAISTTALKSNAPNDQTYINLENNLLSITKIRNQIASQILDILETAEFGNAAFNHGLQANNLPQSSISRLSQQAQDLLKQVKTQAAA